MDLLKREPVAVRGLLLAVVLACVNLAMAFGAHLTGEQMGAINALAGSLLTLVFSLWSRSLVSPVDGGPAPLPTPKSDPTLRP